MSGDTINDAGGATEVVKQGRPPGRARWGTLDLRNLGLVVVLLVLGVVGTVSTDTFLTVGNIKNILVTASIIGVVTVGATLVIIGGGIDLSVGALVALASVWATTLQTQSYGPVVMMTTALVVGVVAGLVNGLLIAYGELVPFIVTLAMLVSARGLAGRISDNRTQIVQSDVIKGIATNEVLGVPVLVLILAAVVAAGWVVLNRTTFGRRIYAIGGNAEAARLAGIDVRRTKVLLYVVSGLCCGIAAIMIMARANVGSSTHGDLYELNAIAAAIIGGTLLSGGRGTIIGALLGVLIFQTIAAIFTLNNLVTNDQRIAQGVIIILAALLQIRANRRSRST